MQSFAFRILYLILAAGLALQTMSFACSCLPDDRTLYERLCSNDSAPVFRGKNVHAGRFSSFQKADPSRTFYLFEMETEISAINEDGPGCGTRHVIVSTPAASASCGFNLEVGKTYIIIPGEVTEGRWYTGMIPHLYLALCDSIVEEVSDSFPSPLQKFVSVGSEFMCEPRLNMIQSIGTHNSYHLRTDPAIHAVVHALNQENGLGIDYEHLPLRDQLDIGIRSFELDLFNDPEGGYYADPFTFPVLQMENPFNASSDMRKPGFKVFHIQAIDFYTTCILLTDCLEQLKSWSDENPAHLPITILIELKEGQLPIPDSFQAQLNATGLENPHPIPFDSAALKALDDTLRDVFDEDHLITSKTITRGKNITLKTALELYGWPSLSQSRGKFMFILNDSVGKNRDLYLNESLWDRVMIPFAFSPDDDTAAVFKRDDVLNQGNVTIKELIELGFLVRTRADANTIEARFLNYDRADLALASGSQIVSTDYPYPRTFALPPFPSNGSYVVSLPGPSPFFRCSPWAPRGSCVDDELE